MLSCDNWIGLNTASASVSAMVTRIDVYKRQGFIQFAHEPYLSYTQLTHAPYPFCLVDKVAVTHRVKQLTHELVSYTHLDVYKRQLLRYDLA